MSKPLTEQERQELARLRADFPGWWVAFPASSLRWQASRKAGLPVGVRAGYLVVEADTPELLRDQLDEAAALDVLYGGAEAVR